MNLQEKLKHYRISSSEYEKICGILNRAPEGLEWALFSALWSEHCSYKSSKRHLKKFYNSSPRVLQSFGENAGVIDLGGGEKVAFKMESHNHPSFIEPYQGAATGVGGILRDIFTMGARPMALANYLCFGEPKADRMAGLVDGVVRGIGGYGNCVGVPTVTGQTEFDSSYNGNILVNAMAVGLFREQDPIVTSAAKGPGNWVVYVGAKTGKDGVHGASMASESFDEDSESKKPTVQIGDPFYEKLLIESCLEVMKKELVVSIQDMGAAGLTSSSFEMAAKGEVGLKLKLDEVPARDSTISPEEILLSESQERMLLICEPKKFEELKEVFEMWDLDAEVIGEVIPEKVIQLYWKGEMVCEIAPKVLVDEAPEYDRPHNPWTPTNLVNSLDELTRPFQGNHLTQLIESFNGMSREWIYEQYDQRVGAATMQDCSESVAILRLPDSQRPMGVVLGCRPGWMRTDVEIGGMDSVAYPCLELSVKGLEPLALTDCLNFGNPEKKDLMTEFVTAVESMSAMCEAMKTPVISGNVSLYNETLEKNVTSTPSTGIVGLGEDLSQIPKSTLGEGEMVYLLPCRQVQGHSYSAEALGMKAGFVGKFDPQSLSHWMKSLRDVVREDLIQSTRAVGKFGLAYSLFRMCKSGHGLKVSKGDWMGCPDSPETSYFVENLYEVVVSVKVENQSQFEQMLKERDLQFYALGKTGGDQLELEGLGQWPLETLNRSYKAAWYNHFPQH